MYRLTYINARGESHYIDSPTLTRLYEFARLYSDWSIAEDYYDIDMNSWRWKEVRGANA